MSGNRIGGEFALRAFADNAAIDAFRAADAVSADRARPLAAMPSLSSEVLERLLEAGRVRQASPGLFYLDDPALRPRRTSSELTIGGVTLLAMLFGAVYYLFRHR